MCVRAGRRGKSKSVGSRKKEEKQRNLQKEARKALPHVKLQKGARNYKKEQGSSLDIKTQIIAIHF